MNQAVKAQEPSMEEILASIRRIIADDDAGKTAKPAEQAAPPPPKPVVVPPPAAEPPPVAAKPPQAAAKNSQGDVDAMLADLDPKPDHKSDPKPKAVAPMPAPTPAPAPPAAPPQADVLDLTEAMTAPPAEPPAAASFRTIDPGSDVIFSDKPPEAAEPVTRGQFTQSAADRALVSHATAAAVDSAFNSLAQTVLGGNARTLEDLVKEMLRPMLKSWLDDNLPGLVERIVRDEIERVSRGRH